MACGAHCADVSLTDADCVWWRHHCVMLMPSWAMLTVHDDDMIMLWWCHPYPGQARGSGHMVFGSGWPIRVKKIRAAHGARLCTWPASSSARAATPDIRFWRGFHLCARIFLLYMVVWSKHNFDNFYFWEKIKHHFKPNALITIVRESDRWCTDSFSLKAKHTDIVFNMVQQTTYIHGRCLYY